MENPNKALQDIIGDGILKSDKKEIKQVTYNEFMNGFEAKGEFICFYFGAHWAPPCRLFTSNLETRLYEVLNEGGESKIEVVFVTDDREETHFKRNFLKMPWYAIPFDDEHKK